MAKQRTVKVRVAVAVDSDGDWMAVGYRDASEAHSADDARGEVGDGASIYWLTAELPIPEAVEVQADVGEAE